MLSDAGCPIGNARDSYRGALLATHDIHSEVGNIAALDVGHLLSVEISAVKLLRLALCSKGAGRERLAGRQSLN